MKRKEALNEVKFEWDGCATVVTWRGVLITVIPPSCSKWERDWMVRAIARTIEVTQGGLRMIVLNEKDADRIASYLRKRFEEVERENAYVEKMMDDTYRKMLDSSGKDSNAGKFLGFIKGAAFMANKAHESEIAELIALLMTGSEE